MLLELGWDAGWSSSTGVASVVLRSLGTGVGVVAAALASGAGLGLQGFAGCRWVGGANVGILAVEDDAVSSSYS